MANIFISYKKKSFLLEGVRSILRGEKPHDRASSRISSHIRTASMRKARDVLLTFWTETREA
ncbi:MAG: hypothetical protein C0522_14580 [Rhodocyclaceae bacterium]|nr:hypothetical protein [Rhodocyclaceae bacterium]